MGRRGFAVFAFVTLSTFAVGQSPSPLMSLEWINPPRELAQGKVTLKVRLIAESDVQLQEWGADGWGSNFAVLISRLSDGGKEALLPPATARGIVRYDKLALARGEVRELVGDFALNNAPGDYELVAQLASSQNARSKPIRVSVKAGRVVDIRK